MSISVDDLVASLNSNHIGQEAMDLATLQAQLAQTLFTQPSAATQSQNQMDITRQGAQQQQQQQPCNTPVASSSAHFNWDTASTSASRRRNNSVASGFGRSASADAYWADAEDVDDEQMVEDLLTPASPVSAPGNGARPFEIPTNGVPSTSYGSGYPSEAQSPTSASASTFASTDPFFLAEMQAQARLAQQPASLFAQAGQPAQQSPFLRHHDAQHQHQHFVHGAPMFAAPVLQ